MDSDAALAVFTDVQKAEHDLVRRAAAIGEEQVMVLEASRCECGSLVKLHEHHLYLLSMSSSIFCPVTLIKQNSGCIANGCEEHATTGLAYEDMRVIIAKKMGTGGHLIVQANDVGDAGVREVAPVVFGGEGAVSPQDLRTAIKHSRYSYRKRDLTGPAL